MTRFTRPRLVVFDVDGTLSDTTDTIVDCWQRAIAACGIEPLPADDIRNRIGQAITTSLPALIPGLTDTQLELFLDRYKTIYIETVTSVPPPLFPGVRETLERLRAAGIAVAVATSKSRPGVDRTLAADDLGHIFPAAYRASADDGPSKPHPKMLVDLLHRTHHQPADAIMVGDTTFDIEMAHAAGVCAVAVTCGAHPRAMLERVEPAAIVETVRDLLPLWG